MSQGNQRTGLPIISDSCLATTVSQFSGTLRIPCQVNFESRVKFAFLPYTQNPDKSEVSSYVSVNSKQYHTPSRAILGH